MSVADQAFGQGLAHQVVLTALAATHPKPALLADLIESLANGIEEDMDRIGAPADTRERFKATLAIALQAARAASSKD